MNFEFKKVAVFESFELNDTANCILKGCDLYSAIAAVAEFPKRLISIFTARETNPFGAYSVKFLVAGTPMEIILDEYFPATVKLNPLFSKPTSNEIWFSLLEKAFAKLYGNYREIQNIQLVEAIETMTGMPVMTQDVNSYSSEELWETLLAYNEKNYLMTVSTSLQISGERVKVLNIVDLYEKENLKIIKMRTPFKDFNWEGTFSHNSKTWTKELKEELNYDRKDTSCIFMDLSEFQKSFSSLSVCYYHEGWFRERIDAVSDSKMAKYFELIIDDETEIYISVHQRLPQHVPESPNYEFSPVEILVTEMNDDGQIKVIGIYPTSKIS